MSRWYAVVEQPLFSLLLVKQRGDVASNVWPCLMCFHCHMAFLCHSAYTPSRFYPLTSFLHHYIWQGSKGRRLTPSTLTRVCFFLLGKPTGRDIGVWQHQLFLKSKFDINFGRFRFKIKIVTLILSDEYYIQKLLKCYINNMFNLKK